MAQEGIYAKIKLEIDEESLDKAEKDAMSKLEISLSKNAKAVETVGKQLETALSSMMGNVASTTVEGQEKVSKEAKKTTKEVGKSLDNTIKKSKEVGRSFLSLKNIMLSLAGVVIGGGGSMFGLKAMVGTTLDLSKSLYEFQRNTGLSTTKLQEWQQAVGRVSGESPETVKNSIMEIQKQMELVKRGLAPAGQFQMMGIDVFTEDAFSALDKIYQKAKGLSPLMAKELFGKMGVSEGIVDTLYEPNAFDNLVRVIPPEEIQKMEKLRRETETFKALLKSVKQESVGLALPDVGKSVEKFTKYLLQNKDVLRTFLTDAIKGMAKLAEITGYVIGHFANFYVGLKGVFELLQDNKVLTGFLAILVPITFLVKKMVEAKSATFGLRDAFKSIMSPLGLVKLGLLALFLIIEDIGTYMRTGGGFTGKLVNWWKDFNFEDVVSRVKNITEQIAYAVKSMFESVFSSIFTSISNMIEKNPLLKKALSVIEKVLSFLQPTEQQRTNFATPSESLRGSLSADTIRRIENSGEKNMSSNNVNVTNTFNNTFNGSVDKKMVDSSMKGGIENISRSFDNSLRMSSLNN